MEEEKGLLNRCPLSLFFKIGIFDERGTINKKSIGVY